MSVVSEIKKGSKKIKSAQLDRITDISGRYFAEYNSSTGECENPVAEPITNIVITGNSTKVNADPDIPNDYVAIEYIELKDKQYIDTGIGSFQDIEVTYQLVGDISEQKQYAKLLYNLAHPLESTYGVEVRTDSKTFTTVNNTSPVAIAYNNNKNTLSLSYRVKEPNYLKLQLNWTIGASSETANVRVYNVKFTNNADTLNGTVGKIDGDFYPVIRKSDNKPGMYDKISKHFFVNQGTGEFITGPELPGKILETDTLTKHGKNLINIPDQEYTQNGVKITVKNGLITLNGTSTGRAWIVLNSTVNLNKGFYYFNKHKNNCLLRINENTVRYIEQSSKFTINEDNITIAAQILQEKNVTYTNKQYIMSVTETSTEQIYEPYQQPEVIDFSNQPIHGIGELKDKIEVVRDVEYNQLVKNGNFENTDNWVKQGNATQLNTNSGVMEVTIGDITSTTPYSVGFVQQFNVVKGHYYFTIFKSKSDVPTVLYEGNILGGYGTNTTTQWQTTNRIFKRTSNTELANCYISLYNPSQSGLSIGQKFYVKDLMVVDITVLFGAGNEPTTLEDFYLTPIGKLVQKGVYLPFSESNNRISKVTRYHATGKEHLGDIGYSSFGNNLFGYNFKQKYKFVLSTYGNVPSICSKYKQNGIISAGNIGEKEYALGSWYFNSGSCAFVFRDSEANNNVDTVKELLKGEYLIAPLNNPYYEDITDTPQGQALLNLAPYQPYTTEFEVNNDGTIEFGYWRQIDPLPDTYTRVKALVSDGNQKITVSDIVGKNLLDPSSIENMYCDGSSVCYRNISMRSFVTKLIKGHTYTFKQTTTTTMMRYAFAKVKPEHLTPIYSNSDLVNTGLNMYTKDEVITFKANNDCYLIITYWRDTSSVTENEARLSIQLEEGTQPTPYSPYISSMQNNSLEMSEPKKTLFQNKDNRVLSVDGYALKYNQLVENGNFKKLSSNGTSPKNWSTINSSLSMEGNFCKLIPTALGSVGIRKEEGEIKISSGHKTLTIARFKRVTSLSSVSLIYLVRVGGGYDEKYADAENNKDVEIGYFITTTDTIKNVYFYPTVNYTNYDEYSLIYSLQTIDLTDMFGAGNEPTTLDEFYATPQGKLYRGYVEYGYHILGAGEYKSNQLVRNGKDIATGWRAYDSSNISVSYSNGAVIATSLKNEEGYGYPFGIQTVDGIKVVKGNKYLLVVDCKTEREDTMMYFDDIGNQHAWSVGKNWTKHEYIWTNTNLNDGYMLMLIKPRHALRLGETYQVREAYSVNLTELGLDHLTLDELKVQRPDLFVYKPYHETETRYGMILSDGRVHPLTGPLYGLNNVKDKGETIGKESRKYGSYIFTGDESYESTTYKRVYVTPSNSFTPKLTGNRSDIANCIFPNLKTVSEGVVEGSEMQIGINQLNGTIAIVLEKYTDSSDMGDIQAVKDAIIGKTFIYELAIPTTTQTTPASIDMDTSVTNEQYTESFTPVEQWIAKYYSGTHAVLNYIPAVRNSDLKPGMYEVATGEFKTNEGTGEFTYINDWTSTESVTLKVDENKVEE